MEALVKGRLCIVKTIDQEMIIGTFVENKDNDVILENPMSIYFQDPIEESKPPRIYLSKYNMFGNNRFTNISKYSIITAYESGDTINTLYDYYVQYYTSRQDSNEKIHFMNSDGTEDEEIEEMIKTTRSSNTTFH